MSRYCFTHQYQELSEASGTEGFGDVGDDKPGLS